MGVRLKAQLKAAVDVISEKEQKLVALEKEKEELITMVKGLSMKLVGGQPTRSMSVESIDPTFASQRVTQLATSNAHTELHTSSQIQSSLEQEAQNDPSLTKLNRG